MARSWTDATEQQVLARLRALHESCPECDNAVVMVQTVKRRGVVIARNCTCTSCYHRWEGKVT